MTDDEVTAHADPIIVAGMHRCGTSLTAGLLAAAGVYMGRESTPANYANPRGYYENVDFVSFHEDALRAEGDGSQGWQRTNPQPLTAEQRTRALHTVRENRSEGPWGWKDPRTTLFLDFWADLLPNARFVLLYRAPWQIVDSLYRRGDREFVEDPHLAIASATTFFERMIAFAERCPNRVLLANAEAVVADPEALLRAIDQRFGITLALPNPTPVFPEELHAGGLEREAVLIETDAPSLGSAFRTLERMASLPGRRNAPAKLLSALAEWSDGARRRERASSDKHSDAVAAFLAIGHDVLAVDARRNGDLTAAAELSKSFVATMKPDSGLEAQALARLESADASRVVTQTGDAIPLPDSSFDLVIVDDSPASARSREAALDEARRVLRPRGVLLFRGLPDTAPDAADQWRLIASQSLLADRFAHVDFYVQRSQVVSILQSLDADRTFNLSCYSEEAGLTNRGLRRYSERGRIIAVCSAAKIQVNLSSIFAEEPAAR